MEKIVLDGKNMCDKLQAHAYIAEKLSFPEYYGANLDALWDCLGELPRGSSILLINREALVMSLGDYGKRLLNTFLQSAMETEVFTFEME